MTVNFLAQRQGAGGGCVNGTGSPAETPPPYRFLAGGHR